jgi:uncharacterized protein
MDRHDERAPGLGLIPFFARTIGLTWAAWLGALWWVRAGDLASPFQAAVPTLLIFFGIGAPALTAVLLTGREQGTSGIRELLRPLIQWRVGPGWYVFAVGYIVVVKLAASGLHRLVEGSWPTTGTQPVLWLLAATALSTLAGGQVGEEVGWRGYALPRMARRYGFAFASLVLGIVWAVWHVPLFFMPGADTYGQSFPLYLIQVTGLSVAVCWLYLRTEGSLLLVMLIHASLNNLTGIVPGVARPAAAPWLPTAPLLGWLTALMIWAIAAGLLLDMTRREPRVGSEGEPLGKVQPPPCPTPDPALP